MVKVSVFYPNTAGPRFDKHVPMVRQKLGAAVKGLSIDQGLSGGQPGTRAAHVMMFHLLFDSVESFQQAFGPHAAAIVGDVPNYTDIQPVIQVSEVKV